VTPGTRVAHRGAIARAGVVVGATIIVAVVLTFLVLPIIALITYQPIGDLLRGLGSSATIDAIRVSVTVNAIAFAITMLVGTPFSYIVARHRFRGRTAVITLVELPLVMPPAVAGLGLLAAFGRLGLLGSTLRGAGIDVAFTQAAVVIAILFVAGPFYLRGAIAAFEALDDGVLDVAGTLGAGPVRRMWAVAIPMARVGLGAAAGVCFARGVGEFGATILFAGSFQGVTQTLPLAVYALFDANLDQAVAIGVLLVMVSAAILFASKLILRSWTVWTSPSGSRAAGSISASS
jgi:molybdate transport system permease protein